MPMVPLVIIIMLLFFRLSVLLTPLLLPVTRSEYAHVPGHLYYDSILQVVCPANASAVTSNQVKAHCSILQVVCPASTSAVSSDQVRISPCYHFS